MASVSSLDQDMRRLRMDRYTPQAAAEVRAWIETTLQEPLAPGDLLDSLKDGIALCKLASLALPPRGVPFKRSDMPFTQRENISNFLAACERPPLSLPSHDRFLTVDLYDTKDPAQVLQCVGAFSRAAHAVNPARFPTVIGPKQRGGASPTRKNGANSLGDVTGHTRGGSTTSVRGVSPAPTGGSDSSRTNDGTYRSPGAAVSSWSRPSDEASTMPAWNIAQYGYMGGASQGNQGISFGARRQITSPAPAVPSLAEKEKLRREKELEAERLRAQVEEEERRRAADLAAEERRARIAEEERWEEETRRAREREREKVEEQKRQWAEEERQWKLAEERRQQEEKAAEEARQAALGSGAGLRGQFLSEYQAQQRRVSGGKEAEKTVSDADKIKQLERQLEEARERERQYQLERQAAPQSPPPAPAASKPTNQPSTKPPAAIHHDSWAEDERKNLQQQWAAHQTPSPPSPPAATEDAPPPLPGPRPRPAPARSASNTSNTPAPPLPGPRPLPKPPASSSPPSDTETPPPLPGPRPQPPQQAKTQPPPSPFARRPASPFTRPAPTTPLAPASAPAPAPAVHDLSQTSAAERAAEDARRVASGQRTRMGGRAATGLLEREMERERERQREWEMRTMGASGGG